MISAIAISGAAPGLDLSKEGSREQLAPFCTPGNGFLVTTTYLSDFFEPIE